MNLIFGRLPYDQQSARLGVPESLDLHRVINEAKRRNVVSR